MVTGILWWIAIWLAGEGGCPSGGPDREDGAVDTTGRMAMWRTAPEVDSQLTYHVDDGDNKIADSHVENRPDRVLESSQIDQKGQNSEEAANTAGHRPPARPESKISSRFLVEEHGIL